MKMTASQQNKPRSKAAEAVGTIRHGLFHFGKTHPGFAVVSESLPGGGSEITTTLAGGPRITVSARGTVRLNGKIQDNAGAAISGAEMQMAGCISAHNKNLQPARKANRPSGPR
jgi:hypothetical protein